jgi:hypothetical protein
VPRYSNPAYAVAKAPEALEDKLEPADVMPRLCRTSLQLIELPRMVRTRPIHPDASAEAKVAQRPERPNIPSHVWFRMRLQHKSPRAACDIPGVK